MVLIYTKDIKSELYILDQNRQVGCCCVQIVFFQLKINYSGENSWKEGRFVLPVMRAPVPRAENKRRKAGGKGCVVVVLLAQRGTVQRIASSHGSTWDSQSAH